MLGNKAGLGYLPNIDYVRQRDGGMVKSFAAPALLEFATP